MYKTQIPGGVISNTRTQLAQLGISDKLQEVLDEVPQVLEDLGHPIMITPFSQFIVTQAVLNVQLGRWEQCLDSCVEFAAGIYGQVESGVAYMDQDIKDKLLSQPSAKGIMKKAEGLLEYINTEPSEAECKKKVGLSPDASLEKFVMMYNFRGDEELNKCTPGGPEFYKKYL
jgi:oxaloacetate decarboxylase alpha subunit